MSKCLTLTVASASVYEPVITTEQCLLSGNNDMNKHGFLSLTVSDSVF